MLACKQVVRQMGRNPIFLLLLFLLCILSSVSFFFVRFSIDGNRNRVSEILEQGGDGERYQAAISSNSTLASAFLVSTIALTAFVFFLFFYRFARTNKKQLGTLKSLGFTDAYLRRIWVGFSLVLGILGGLAGLIIAWPLSEVLINSNFQAYGVIGLKKSLSAGSILVYFVSSLGVFSLVSFVSYCLIKGAEPGVLLAGNNGVAKETVMSRFAARVAETVPVKNKLALRVMLRKPVILVLLFLSVFVFSTFMLMAYSIHISSGKVLESQTKGYNYTYSTSYSEFVPLVKDKEQLPLLQVSASLSLKQGRQELIRNLTGLPDNQDLLQLEDLQGQKLGPPQAGTAIVGKELYEVYGVRVGDVLDISLNGKEIQVTVAAVAMNAQAGAVYLNDKQLANSLGLEERMYNLLLSTKEPTLPGDTQSHDQRMGLLESEAVSNKTSAVINQVIGVSVGCVLLLLALFMAFQDNTRDMLILRMMGYPAHEIRKMFMDVYRPFIGVSYVVGLVPSLLLVQRIMRNLSVATGDYMPFASNILTILFVFVLVNLIFQLVLWLLGFGLFKTMKNEKVQEYISAE